MGLELGADVRTRERARFAAVCAALGLTAGASGAAPPASDAPSFAAALGESIHGAVSADDIRWQPSRGMLLDALAGRWVLFLGAAAPGQPRDVYRARVRVTPEGRPLSIAATYDLTQTPLGDDHALVVEGERAAFATNAYGQEQSVTALDFAGEPATATTSKGLVDRVTGALTNQQQTGSLAGVLRVDVTIDPPATRVGLALEPKRVLRIDRLDDAGVHAGGVDVGQAEVAYGGPGLHAEVARHLRKPLVFWAVDTVRAVPWIGPEPIAWLEDKAFALRDATKQVAFKLHGADATETLATAAEQDAALAPAALLDTSKASADDAEWPPRDIASIWSKPEPDEGRWVEPKIAWLKRIPGAPSPFVRTFVRPDSERPYATVLMVAMDSRQLDLEMEAGTEDPKPLTGGHGPGRIPRDPRVSTRVAAAFNGAFKTEHGNYGMMVHKRLLLPPQPGAATVVVLEDGRAAFGTWGAQPQVTALRGIPEADIVSFRQNLDPLIDRGEINPTKRALWGYTMPGSGTQTERSGVCVTGGGHVIYAWGDDVNATTLARAMKMAGCVYGMHLDMNPHHTGFVFANVEDLKARKFKSQLLSTDMEIYPDRYIDYAPKDFFYMLLRDPSPEPIAKAERSEKPGDAAAWKVDPGAQPAPTWLPGIFQAAVAGVELTDVEAGRAAFRLRAGTSEPDGRTGASPVTELAPEDASRVLFAVGLGVARDKHPRGLATAGRLIAPVRGGPSSAVLVASADGQLSIARAEGDAAPTALAGTGDLAEVPLLFDGALSKAKGEGAPGARFALGTTAGGRVIVARGESVTEAQLEAALRGAGCTRAVLLDRGARDGRTFDRAGGASPPRGRYEETTLYAVARSMRPRAFRFDAETSVAEAR